MSKSTRCRLYLLMTFSIAEAMELTLVQLSAISVLVVSAVYPPKEGMTSPPRERMVLIDEANVDPIGDVVLVDERLEPTDEAGTVHVEHFGIREGRAVRGRPGRRGGHGESVPRTTARHT